MRSPNDFDQTVLSHLHNPCSVISGKNLKIAKQFIAIIKTAMEFFANHNALSAVPN
jgi:hypothetical protein